MTKKTYPESIPLSRISGLVANLNKRCLKCLFPISREDHKYWDPIKLNFLPWYCSGDSLSRSRDTSVEVHVEATRLLFLAHAEKHLIVWWWKFLDSCKIFTLWGNSPPGAPLLQIFSPDLARSISWWMPWRCPTSLMECLDVFCRIQPWTSLPPESLRAIKLLRRKCNQSSNIWFTLAKHFCEMRWLT